MIQDKGDKPHKKILLGQLGRRGDCLYATAVARQIKEDFPVCHLTWAISSMCRPVIDNNPYVDKIWELPLKTNDEIVSAWKQFEVEALNKKANGEFDEVFLTQVHPGNMQNYDGTSRASLFRGYPRPITVPVQPVVRLSNEEVGHVRRFADLHGLRERKQVILFECASTSGQSFVDPAFALSVAQTVLKDNPDVCFILSSNVPVEIADQRIIDGSVLSYKENAELTKYCTLLVGCSSGISWLATSDWAKPLPKIQLLSADTRMYASMIHDARFFGLSTDDILEMLDCSSRRVADCIRLFFDRGFGATKKHYHQEIPLDFQFYLRQVYWELLSKGESAKAATALSVTMDRFGRHPQLVYFIQNLFSSYLDLTGIGLSKDDVALILGKVNVANAAYTSSLPGHIGSYIRLAKAVLREDTRLIGKLLLKDVIKKAIHA